MNMPLKPELFAPCFPYFSIDMQSIEVESDMVYFNFKIGSSEIACEIKGEQLTDSVCCGTYSDPENSLDVDYTKIEVDTKTLAKVTQSDISEIKEELGFILTDKQVFELNEWLAFTAIEELEMAA